MKRRWCKLFLKNCKCFRYPGCKWRHEVSHYATACDFIVYKHFRNILEFVFIIRIIGFRRGFACSLVFRHVIIHHYVLWRLSQGSFFVVFSIRVELCTLSSIICCFLSRTYRASICKGDIIILALCLKDCFFKLLYP